MKRTLKILILLKSLLKVFEGFLKPLNHKYIPGFTWLLVLTHISENPENYDFSPYLKYLYLFCILLAFVVLFVIKFKSHILAIRDKCFVGILNNSKLSYLLFKYCTFIIKVKGFFEIETPILVFTFSLPNTIWLFSTILQEPIFLAKPVFWVSFWFSLGLLLISWDQTAIKIITFCEEEPSKLFSVKYKNFLNSQKQESLNLLFSGWVPRFTKITAAGQAALFTGSAALFGTVFVASINTWHLVQKETADRQAQANKEAADRQAQTNKEAADRQAKASKQAADRQAQDQRATADRQAQASKEAADRQLKKEHDTAKYADREAQRSHEKEKMASETKKSWWSR